MPTLALALAALWFLILFVLRSWLQWRRTGAIGLNGFKGRIGSLEWFAGLTATAGLILAPVAPLASLRGWPLAELYFYVPVVHGLGALIALVGIGLGFASQLAMGSSWRIGVDDTERTTLITSGPFRFARNPIFTSIVLSLGGFVCVAPSHLSVLTLLLVAVGIHLQVRYVEEPYLLATHGDSYADYRGRVGRYLPRCRWRKLGISR